MIGYNCHLCGDEIVFVKLQDGSLDALHKQQFDEDQKGGFKHEIALVITASDAGKLQLKAEEECRRVQSRMNSEARTIIGRHAGGTNPNVQTMDIVDQVREITPADGYDVYQNAQFLLQALAEGDEGFYMTHAGKIVWESQMNYGFLSQASDMTEAAFHVRDFLRLVLGNDERMLRIKRVPVRRVGDNMQVGETLLVAVMNYAEDFKTAARQSRASGSFTTFDVSLRDQEISYVDKRGNLQSYKGGLRLVAQPDFPSRN